MPNTTAILGQAVVQLISAALYIWVGSIVMRRPIEGEARRANTLFGVWWLALGLVFVLLPVYSIPVRLLGYRDLALAVTLINTLLMLIVIAVWGLVYYLVYLYTGSQRSFVPLTAFYGVFGVVILYLIAWLGPIGFTDEGTLQYAREPLRGAPAILLGLAFSGPVVLAAIGYGSLYFRVPEAAQKYRIGLVSGGFLLQWGWSLTSSLLQLNQRFPNSLTLALVSNALGIVAAVAVLLAFRPPRSIRAKLGIAPAGGA